MDGQTCGGGSYLGRRRYRLTNKVEQELLDGNAAAASFHPLPRFAGGSGLSWKAVPNLVSQIRSALLRNSSKSILAVPLLNAIRAHLPAPTGCAESRAASLGTSPDVPKATCRDIRSGKREIPTARNLHFLQHANLEFDSLDMQNS